jgi:hypothetical protein
MPSRVEEHRGYRIAIYSPLNHYAVVTPPGGNAVIDFGKPAVATVVEGADVCLVRAKTLIDDPLGT